MSIGAIIKQKRQSKDLTQEQFAEYLNVSVSAVSQWESGRTMPDFSLLVPLAEFFGISLDELFGRTPGEREEAIANYDKKSVEFTNKGNTDAAIVLWREALARFPGDFHCMVCLAQLLLMRICADDCAETATNDAEECTSLCESILRDCKDSQTRDGAIQTLSLLYSTSSLIIADEKKAVKYAMMASSRYSCRERLLEHAYFSAESQKKRTELIHNNRLNDMDDLVISLMRDTPVQERLNALETSLQLWGTLIYDGNYLFFHTRIADVYEKIAGIYAAEGQKEESLCALEKALFHANAYDTRPEGEHHYSSVFVCAATDDKSKTSTNNIHTRLEQTLEFARSLYSLRDDPNYQDLMKKYDVSRRC